MNTINVLVSVNQKFLEHVEEMIFSILFFSSRQVHIYLMYQENELSKNDISNLSIFVEKTKKGKIIPIEFKTDNLKGMPVTDNEGSFFGMEAYSRLFCAFKIPKEIDKILYLDADMICTGDIKELYDISFDGKTWVACRDKGIKDSDLKRLGLKENCKYINSGMLLLNVKKLRDDYTEIDITNLIRENEKILIYPDQDFINKIFENDIKIINSKYNLIAKDTRYKELESKPLIIHYAGSVKPWSDDVSRFDEEFIKPYYEILRLQQETKKEKLEKILKKHKVYGYNNT